MRTRNGFWSRRRVVVALTVIVVAPAVAVTTWTLTKQDAVRPVSLRVDPLQVPSRSQVEGLEDGGPPRPVGRVASEDGTTTDVVRGELIVSVAARPDLDGLLRRWNGRVLDQFEPVPGERLDFLVAVDPPAADVARAARDLTKADPQLSGGLRVGDVETLNLIAVAASETANQGMEVSLNWLGESAGFSTGTSIEAENLSERNAFNWLHLRSGGPHDVGVGAAWQLLEGYGKFRNKVRIMIADGGFNPNVDFPVTRKIRKAKWGDRNPADCSGGVPCPWHGTQVVVTAMGRADNSYGVTGPASPVAELIAYENYDDRWKNYRKMKEVVREEHPHVLNMSFSADITLFKGASESAADRHFKSMINEGTFLIASAGNEGRNVDQETCGAGTCWENTLWLPCESKHVLCVGGTERTTTSRHDDSNYGSASGDRTVEIYAPYCMHVLKDPRFPHGNAAVTGCGTSYSSPLIAGIAALVKAANPGLSPVQIRDILMATSHNGGVLPEFAYPNAKQRRVNALLAVASALGVEIVPPAVTIAAPANGKTFGVNDWIDLRATATDFARRNLPVTWRSNVDRTLTTGPKLETVTIPPLEPGTYVLTASATDIRGKSGSASVTIKVVDRPPVMEIVSPTVGEQPYESQPIALIGSSADPDTQQPLDPESVSWRITSAAGGPAVLTAEGHWVELMPGRLDPGNYTVSFIGSDAGATATATRSLKVLADPPGGEPVVTILSPKSGSTVDDQGTLTFKGSATDAEDGSLSGTRFRWIAVSDQGTEKVLCVGSNFPGSGSGGGGFTIQKSCKEFTAKLGLDYDEFTPGMTTWAITLEVVDSSGAHGKDVNSLTVTHTEG